MLYFVGEPLAGVDFGEEELSFPSSQADIYCEVLEESASRDLVECALRREYAAIVSALKSMDIDFMIPLLYPGPTDRNFLKELDCRTIHFGNILPGIMACPRDFCVVLEEAKLLLLNSRAVKEVVSENNGWSLMVSPYGEGGRVLVRDSTMIIGDTLSNISNAGVDFIVRTGMNIGIFPSVATTVWSRSKNAPTGFKCNTHIDRVACLLRGRDKKQHLIVDPLLETVFWDESNRWVLRKPAETLDLIRQTFEPMGIKVWQPAKIEVPCSLGMVQFKDGRVLMTGGDQAVRELVCAIVGAEDVFDTGVPIKFLPLWKRAGIHCIIGEAPMPLLGSCIAN
jgi:hypothetical protein